VLTRILSIIVLVCLSAGCVQQRQAIKRPLTDGEGELFLYVEPFPQDAGRLKFTLTGVAAIRDDGVTVPLTPGYNDFTPQEQTRQRLFAQGVVPPGRYTGLAFTVKSASLIGEEGAGHLLVPDKPFENRAEFVVKGGKATVVALDLKYRESVFGGVTFRPLFSPQIPPLPLPDLTGYLTNLGSNTITVFDRRAARIGAMIETGRGPAGIALDQSRLRAYVALSGEDALAVLDVKENDFVDRIRLNPGDEPHFVVLTPNGKTAVTANTGSNTVSIVDVLTLTEVARVAVGNGPEYVLMGRNGQRAYVFNRLSNSISVIDLATRTLAGTMATESGPIYGQFNRSGDRLYVYHDMSPTILVLAIDLQQTVSRRINAGMGVSAMKLNTATDRLYAGKNFGGLIDIYDPFTLMASDFLIAAGGIGFMTIDGDENNLLVVHPQSRLVRMINLVSRKERGLLDTGADPYCAVVFGER